MLGVVGGGFVKLKWPCPLKVKAVEVPRPRTWGSASERQMTWGTGGGSAAIQPLRGENSR